jgi:hypothetical protein
MQLPVAELVEGTAMVVSLLSPKKLPKNDSSLGFFFNKEPSLSSLSFACLRNSEPLVFLTDHGELYHSFCLHFPLKSNYFKTKLEVQQPYN